MMGGDEEHPESLEVMERHLMPQILAAFAQIVEICGKYGEHQDERLAALRMGQEIPAAATRACEEYRREFAPLVGKVHLNSLRIEQLVVQIADFGRRLECGDTAAVVADSRMLPDEVRRVATRIGKNNRRIERATKELMDSNLRAVISIAKKYINRGLQYHDLIKAGSAGLQQAIDDFDHKRFYSFSIFASWRIHQAIRRALEHNNPSPRPDKTIRSNPGETTTLVLASLTPREERVLRMRFGIGMNTDRTLEEVGQQFSVTRERIRQIEAKALRMLKEKARQTGTRPAKAPGATSEERSREAELAIFKRIEASRRNTVAAVCGCPLTMHAIVRWRDQLLQGTLRLRDVIDLKAAHAAGNYGNGKDGDDGR